MHTDTYRNLYGSKVGLKPGKFAYYFSSLTDNHYLAGRLRGGGGGGGGGGGLLDVMWPLIWVSFLVIVVLMRRYYANGHTTDVDLH